MVILNLILDNVKFCELTITFVKECEKIITCKKTGILNVAYKRGLLFEKSKGPDKFKEMHKENGVSKTRKSVRKVSKTRSDNEFK